MSDSDIIYNPNYPYKNKQILTGLSEEGFPILEHTNNGLLFPECPQDDIDIKEFRQNE